MAVAVALIDYGTGNLASLEMAVEACGGHVLLASTPADLQSADAVILPGVGHFGPASQHLECSGLRRSLLELAGQGLPMLGICLGFQLLTSRSEEQPDAEGLALLPLATQRLRPVDMQAHKVPHLGWNTLQASEPPPRLLAEIPPERQLFYFANAFGVPAQQDLPLPRAHYHHESPWLGLVEHGCLFGVQFHPEKSRSQGLQLLRNFIACAGEAL